MTVRDFINDAEGRIKKGWVIAALTDEYIIDSWPVDGDFLSGREGNLLEMRVFGENGELKLSRFDIGRDFSCRGVFDEGEDKDIRDHYDEVQYLDIDDSIGKTADGKVTATGGGIYSLPLSNPQDAKIRIRYYLGSDDENGQARIEDWRVVELVEGK